MRSHLGTRLISWILVVTAIFFSQSAESQSLKKVTIGISATNVNYLPFFVALRKGFYRDEGVDLQVIYMASTLTSRTVLTGDVDYSGAVSGVVGAAVQGQPLKVVMFTVARPLLFLISRKEITEPQQLKGKKIAGSTPGASATLLATQALRHFGLEPGRDVAIMPMGGSAAGRYAILESGVVDASVLSVPENIIAQEKGFRELLFLGDIIELPQTGESARRTRRFARTLTRSIA